MSGRPIPQDFDFLGSLRERLFGLSGFKTLALELIQNAEDAKADSMSFEFTAEALIVTNSSKFRDVDFDRMKNIASGGKKEEEGTIGTFGIGFVSVYQITDHPELISAGKHWTFRPEKISTYRIWEEDTTDCIDSTKFIFPWALKDSEIRKKLEQTKISQKQIEIFEKELIEILPSSLLFLKTLNTIEVYKKSKQVFNVQRSGNRYDGKIQIQINAQVTSEWYIYQTEFEKNIDNNKKSNEVFLAITNDEKIDHGLVFAYLPTKIETNFPFNFSADFYPTPDRKNIVLDGDEKAEWNKRATQAVADIFNENLLEIRDRVDYIQLYKCFSAFKKYEDKKLFGNFWKTIKTKLLQNEIVLDYTKKWRSTDQITIFSDKKEEFSSSLITELGLNIVHPDLRSYYSIITEIGVKVFNIHNLIDLIKNLNIQSGTEIGINTNPLNTKEKLKELYKEFNFLLNQINNDSIKNEILNLNIGASIEGKLYKLKDLRKLNLKELNLFDFLISDILVADDLDLKSNLIIYEIPKLKVEDIINLIKNVNSQDLKNFYIKNEIDLPLLYEYFADNLIDIKINPYFLKEFKELPIFLSNEEFKQLNELSLPGNFSDPLNLDILIQGKISGKVSDFLKEIGVKELDLATYCIQHIPRILLNYDITIENKRLLVDELVLNFSKIKDHSEVIQKLKNCELVECQDNNYRIGKEVYIDNEVVKQVLEGVEYNKVNYPENNLPESYNDFYRTIGVTESPKFDDILNCIKNIIVKPVDESGKNKIKEFYNYLSSKWDEYYKNSTNKIELKELNWLPADDSIEWFKPCEIYLPFRKYLFESQSYFLSFRPQSKTDFEKFIEIEVEPTIQQVIDHVLYCSSKSENVNREVYKYLNDNSDETEINQLKDKHCINIGDRIYVKPNQVFWYENPFSDYRYRLNESLKDFIKLFECLGVKDKPDYSDYISIVDEISGKYGSQNTELNDEDYKILNNAYIKLQNFYSEGLFKDFELNSLKAKKTIPQNDRLLYKPNAIFFDDKPSLSKKLIGKLIRNTIPRDASNYEIFEKLGVRYLSESVERKAEIINPEYDSYNTVYLKSLNTPIKRFLYSKNTNIESKWDEKILDDLEIFKVEDMQINYIIKFGETESEFVESGKIQEKAYYDSSVNRLYLKNGEIISSITSSKELTFALNQKEDVSEYVALIKEILSSGSPKEAQELLNEYDIDNIIQTEVEETKSGQEIISIGTEYEEGKSGMKYSEKKADDDYSDLYGSSFKSKRNQLKPNITLISKVTFDSEGESNAKNKQNSKEIIKIDKAGIEAVLRYEVSKGRIPREMAHNHEGYDIESYDSEGKLNRYIEVKSTKYRWDGFVVQMSDSQFFKAKEMGEKFFLYVVDYVFNEATIYEIQDPANKATGFLFDSGWKDSGIVK